MPFQQSVKFCSGLTTTKVDEYNDIDLSDLNGDEEDERRRC